MKRCFTKSGTFALAKTLALLRSPALDTMYFPVLVTFMTRMPTGMLAAGPLATTQTDSAMRTDSFGNILRSSRSK